MLPDLESILPERVLDTSVRRIVPIVGGEIHQVYRLEGTSQSLIVRCALDRHNAFESEVKALEICRSEGLPVPEIVAMEHVESDGRHLCICIEVPIEGRSLDVLLLDDADWNLEHSRRYAEQVGACLGRLHNVQSSEPLLHAGRSSRSRTP